MGKIKKMISKWKEFLKTSGEISNSEDEESKGILSARNDDENSLPSGQGEPTLERFKKIETQLQSLFSWAEDVKECSDEQHSDAKVKVSGGIKGPGNKVQFEFNSDVLYRLKKSQKAVKRAKPERALNHLKKAVKLLNERQEEILIADRSRGGWKVVELLNSFNWLGDDSKAKKIRHAETLCDEEKKRKEADALLAKNKRRQYGVSPVLPAQHSSNYVSMLGQQLPLAAALPNQPALQPFLQGAVPGRGGGAQTQSLFGAASLPGLCYYCLQPGHRYADCEARKISLLQQQQPKK